jgi:predicted dehydrogenase
VTADTPRLGIAMIGAGKMARAHSQAYLTATRFFDLPLEPVFSVLAGHTRGRAEQVARAFGWQDVSCDWREVVARDDVDLVDICAPNALHAEIACAAAERGKAVVCEKPLAVDLRSAERMVEAVERARVAHMVVFNYRYAPAVRHAHDLLASGRLGEVRQFRLHFLQDWLVDATRPMSWRLRADEGGGALLDLGAHLVDLVHHLIGPIARVAAAGAQFVTERPDQSGVPRPVDVEDVAEALVVTRSGAVGSFGVSRVAGGHLCQNGFEIVASGGSVRWELQRLNELDVYLTDGPAALRGWRTVSVTAPGVHPWADAWWGAGHPLGYAETMVHQLAAVVGHLGGAGPEPEPPTFRDGLRCQRVLAAVARAARAGQWVEV